MSTPTPSLRASAWGPDYLRFGLSLTNNFQGTASYSALLGVARTQLNGLGAEWVTNVAVGDALGIVTTYYQPWDPGGVAFVGVGLEAGREKADIYTDGELSGQHQIGRLVGLVEVGLNLGTAGQISFGASSGGLWGEESVGSTHLESQDVRLAALNAPVIVDLLDNANFPKRGFSAFSTAYLSDTRLGADDTYQFIQAAAAKPLTAARLTLLPFVRLSSALTSRLPPYGEASLGGLFNLSGYPEGRSTGSHSCVRRADQFPAPGRHRHYVGRRRLFRALCGVGRDLGQVPGGRLRGPAPGR